MAHVLKDKKYNAFIKLPLGNLISSRCTIMTINTTLFAIYFVMCLAIIFELTKHKNVGFEYVSQVLNIDLGFMSLNILIAVYLGYV